jgi:chromosome segregation ATPase
MATDLANGLTQVLVRAMQDLERHVSTESERLGSTFGQRLDRLQSSMEALQPLHHRIEQLFQTGAAVQKKVDELAAATASWGEAHARLDSDVAALRLQMDQLSASMSSRVEEVCRRVEAQEREISTIQANASELASKMAVAAERLEKHATAIRSLHDSHRERTEVFGQMGELLHRLNHRPAATEGSAL